MHGWGASLKKDLSTLRQTRTRPSRNAPLPLLQRRSRNERTPTAEVVKEELDEMLYGNRAGEEGEMQNKIRGDAWWGGVMLVKGLDKAFRRLCLRGIGQGGISKRICS